MSTTDSGARCIGCGDPAPRGFEHCLHCHAWNDLYQALHFAKVGLDEFRFNRARRHFSGRSPGEPLPRLLAKLGGLLDELEVEAGADHFGLQARNYFADRRYPESMAQLLAKCSRRLAALKAAL